MHRAADHDEQRVHGLAIDRVKIVGPRQVADVHERIRSWKHQGISGMGNSDAITDCRSSCFLTQSQQFEQGLTFDSRGEFDLGKRGTEDVSATLPVDVLLRHRDRSPPPTSGLRNRPH